VGAPWEMKKTGARGVLEAMGWTVCVPPAEINYLNRD